MRVASVCNAYNEERFIAPHLDHLPDWVEEKLVLVSSRPWYGDDVDQDLTYEKADSQATVLRYPWKNESEQRNAGQAYLYDYDWILNLEPDEFFSNEDWEKLHKFLETAPGQAYTVKQRVFWGKGFESDPSEDFVPIIATRPNVLFAEKRNVNTRWETIPDITLLHFAWARTDEEIWKKISHYSHAVDFDIDKWYKEVWLARKTENVHPTTASAIPKLKKAVLPPEIERLNLWP